jgi:hypothetical protein
VVALRPAFLERLARSLGQQLAQLTVVSGETGPIHCTCTNASAAP